MWLFGYVVSEPCLLLSGSKDEFGLDNVTASFFGYAGGVALAMIGVAGTNFALMLRQRLFNAKNAPEPDATTTILRLVWAFVALSCSIAVVVYGYTTQDISKATTLG